MNFTEPFPNPPIIEALIDIRCELPSQINLNALEKYQEEIKDRFPIKEERSSWKGGFQLKKGGSPELLQPAGGVDGYVFKSLPQDAKIVQARLDGFTFNKLKPYTEWPIFSAEGKELWEIYKKMVQPVNVTRVALKYINSIEIPLSVIKLEDYLLTYPKIAEGLPELLKSYFMNIEIIDTTRQMNAIIIQTIKPIQQTTTKINLIFDIDVYKIIKLHPDDTKIWEALDELRIFKDEIFRKSLTNKAQELFK